MPKKPNRLVTSHEGKDGHTFGKIRPDVAGPRLHVLGDTATHRDERWRDLPKDVPGKPPYQLDLKDVIAPDIYGAIKNKKRLVFHLNGDMGGIRNATPQELVAAGMEGDFASAAGPGDNPAFLYILGDCVYFNGQVEQYYSQFYEPYLHYPAPIFAVPGNHDGENVVGQDPLDGFVRNFCAPEPIHREEAQDSDRTAMTQPNVYWTLLTPLATLIGMYSNVPEGGMIKEPQISWLVQQLGGAPKSLPVFVALHHPVYSADKYHSGSTHMKTLIESAAEKAGRHPDMVLAGHVHDYQRLTKTLDEGSAIPYLVVGAGGYHNLHPIQTVNGEKMVAPVTFLDKGNDPVTLESYVDDRWGFFRMEITPDVIKGSYYTVPRPQEPFSKPSQLVDYFEFDWKNKKYIPNHLGG